MNTNTITKTIYFKGVMGEIADPLSPVLQFSLLVHPYENTVSGTVKLTLSNGEEEVYSGQVTGSTHASGFKESVRLINIRGNFPPQHNLSGIVLPFEANMSLDSDWNGSGGMTFKGKNYEKLPIKGSIFNLDSSAE
ncbi:DUF1842 domain-containing protein [Tenacibaculum sp. 190524A05c]|uniref:DUF1842 domain-containing protein n=1 Tax=Tenacibaculum platacis TaxID=3137852 RepID=A0ABM9NS89_9FLAO